MADAEFAHPTGEATSRESGSQESASEQDRSLDESSAPRSAAGAAPVGPPRSTSGWGRPAAGPLWSRAQAKLAVDAVDSPLEAEADAMAEQVVRQTAGAGAGHAADHADPSPQATPLQISRAPAGAIPGSLGSSAEGGEADQQTEEQIERSRGGGQPLDAGIRGQMEGAFGGHDFSGVRVHTDSQAQGLNQGVDARAFTVGNDIFMGQGESAGDGKLLAHELTHVVQQSQGRVQVSRWGKGDKGRSKQDEQEIIDEHGRSPDDVAKVLKKHLTKGMFKSQHTRFNKVMQLVTTPSVSSIASAYGNKYESLTSAINESFGVGSFRSQYLTNVINRGGFPDIEYRIRMALGLAGANSQGMVSDQEEATRLFQSMPPDKQKNFFDIYRSEFKAGMSSKGFAQVEALASASEHQETLKGATTPPRDGQDGVDSDQQEAAALGMLDAFDRELAKIVSRGLKAESTAFFDAVTVRTSADVGQMAGEVKGWVKRAKEAESVFEEKDVIRRSVLGWKTTFTTPDGKSHTIERRGEFLTAIYEREFKHGWNRADQAYIYSLVAGGTGIPAKAAPGGQQDQGQQGQGAPQAQQGQQDQDQVPGPDDSVQDIVANALRRATSMEVIAALGAIRGELLILKKTFQKNRRSRIREEIAAIPPEESWELLASLTGLEVPHEDWDDPTRAKHELKLRNVGIPIATRVFKEVKLKDKHVQQFAGKLGHGAQATPGYLEVRRYAFKQSFKTGKFLKRVSDLSPDERKLALLDDELRQQVEKKLAKKPGDLQQVKSVIGWGVVPTAPPLDLDEAGRDSFKKEREQRDWATRWGTLISGTKDHKKIFNFALQILDAGKGSSQYLRDVRGWLKDGPKGKLDGTSLGKALVANKEIGHGGGKFDLTAEIIGKSKTARPKGSANVDAICQSFESLSGKLLLQEWTNVHEIGGDGSVLALRKVRMEELHDYWMKANLDDPDELEGLHQRISALQTIGRQVVGTTLVTMREERRKQLNSGLSSLTTNEYQTVKERHAAKIALALKGDEDFRQALLDKGMLPNELEVVGSQVLFVADKAKQANLDTWHQWSLFTNRGQLRMESSGILSGRMTALQDTASKGGDTSQDQDDFAAQRAELKSRTKAFVDTANAYKDRLKQIINVILSVIVVIGTAGIGGVGVLGMAGINLAIELVKQAMMNGLDQFLQPGQSSFGAEMLLGSIKTLLMTGVTLGVAALTAQLQQSFNLVDAQGLKNGNYLVDGNVHQSTALKVGTKFSDSSGSGWGTNLGMKMITGAVSKAGGKVVNLVVDSISDGPKGALKKLQASLKWTELLDMTVGVAFKDFVSRVQGEMLKDVKTDGTKSEEERPDPSDPSKTITVKVQKDNTNWGAVDGLDPKHSQKYDVADSAGSKRVKATAKLSTDMTVIKAMNKVYSAPTGALDSAIANRRDGTTHSMATSDGPSEETKSAIADFLLCYEACSGDPANHQLARALLAATMQVMGDPAKLQAVVTMMIVKEGYGPSAARKRTLEWLKEVVNWAKKIPPPPPPGPPPSQKALQGQGS